MICRTQKIKMVKINDIISNPYQIRRKFDQKSLNFLRDSIKQIGVISPVILRGASEGYEIICGQRRVRAAQMAGLSEIPAIIVRAGDVQCALLSMAENIHRENLSTYEEGEGYFNLLSYHRIKKETLLSQLSAESSRINEKIRMLRLSENIRYKIEENKIGEREAAELLKLHSEEKQLEIINEIAEKGLKYTEVESLVRKTLREMSSAETKTRKKSVISSENMAIYLNTVEKTADLLKNNGAKVEINKKESEKHVEYTIKVYK